MKRIAIVLIAMGMLPWSLGALEPTDPVKINEIYYGGTPNYTYQDQFVELYNAGTSACYLDGAVLIRGVDTMATRVYQFSGEIGGTTLPIEPGEFVVIAQDAWDFSSDPYSVDLSDAEYETYSPYEEDPGDNPNVANLNDAIELMADFVMDLRVGQVMLATGDSLEVVPCETG
jgi:hypothetical protein